MIFFQQPFSQKFTALIVVACFIGATIGPVLLFPRQARAQCPVFVVEDVPEEKNFSIETAWEALKKVFRAANLANLAASVAQKAWDNAHKLMEWGQGVLLNLLLHQILAQLTNDIVNWIQNGEEPRFLSMGLGDWLGMAADNAVGAFIDQYLGAGWLCEPFDIDIKVALLDVPTFEEEARCTLSDIVGNIEDFYNDFSKGGWAGWIELTKPQNNFYGAYLLAKAEKMSVEEEAKREAEQDLEMGQGYLSPKDCEWRDAKGVLVETQKDIWGSPPLPNACKPDPKHPGKTVGGFDAPCYKKCRILTPASSVKRLADKAITNYYDQINAQIAGATAKAGPYQVYVQAIINALINRIITEGVGLLKATAESPPAYGDIGTSTDIPAILSPEQVLKDKNAVDSLSSQLNLTKQNLENELLNEQKNNLAVLKLIPPAYSEVLPVLDNVISACATATPYTTHVSWAQTQKDNINNNLIPSFNQKINQMEKVEIPKTINLVNNVNTAIVSAQDYSNKADNWLTVYKEVEGKADDLKLKAAGTEVNQSKNKLIADVQKVVEVINGTVTSTDISGLNQEVQNANTNVITLAIDLKTERGNPTFPDPGTLYAELEAARNLKDEANNKLNQCLNWTAEFEYGY